MEIRRLESVDEAQIEGLADVLSVTVFLTDMGQYSEFNAVYARLFRAPYPARACVAVSALPANLRVEVQAVAARR